MGAEVLISTGVRCSVGFLIAAASVVCVSCNSQATGPQSIQDENPAHRLAPKENLTAAQFGFREREYAGLGPQGEINYGIESCGWDEADDSCQGVPSSNWGPPPIEAAVTTHRYNLGPPPNGDVRGFWINGTLSTSLVFDPTGLRYNVGEHTFSYYSYCGTNSHSWDTFFRGLIYINTPTGGRFRYHVTGSGTEILSSPDTGFGYDVSTNVGSFNPLRQSGALDGEGRSTTEIEVEGKQYSLALALSVSGSAGAGYSNILLCPHIGWHTSGVSNLVVEATVEPDCCPVNGDIQTWCQDWNGSSCALAANNNCWSYATNIKRDVLRSRPPTLADPKHKAYTCDDIVEAGADYFGTIAGKECGWKECLVAAYEAPICSYEWPGGSTEWYRSGFHWARKNQDGSWSHKSGLCPPAGVVGEPGPGHTIPRDINICDGVSRCLYKFCAFLCVPCDANTSDDPPNETTKAATKGVESITVIVPVGAGEEDRQWQIVNAEKVAYVLGHVATDKVRVLGEGETVDTSTLSFGGFLLEPSAVTEGSPRRYRVFDNLTLGYTGTSVLVFEGTAPLFEFLRKEARSRWDTW